MGNAESHRQKVETLRQSLLSRKSDSRRFCLSPGKTSPNTTREGTYKKDSLRVDMRNFDAIVEVNIHDRTVLVEPKATMEKLFSETEAFGLMPKVLPEFKGITVGGAINGAALESSSFRYGQFNDTCLEFEVLLGDGRVVTASREENIDLFYGLSGSYGTLGIITAAKIALNQALPFVLLEYSLVSSCKEAVQKMEKLAGDPAIDFLEAIAYAKDSCLIISGKMTGSAPAEVARMDLSRSYSPWFYQRVIKSYESKVYEELLPLQDYLFRHDRAAFWLGGFALHPKLLIRYVLEVLGFKGRELDRKLFLEERAKIGVPKESSPLFRLLFGWLMGSKRLYRFLHSGTEKWFSNNFCIQDYYLPGGSVEAFTGRVFDECGISPLWLCPILATDTPQILSPHHSLENRLLFDVGVYGMPARKLGEEVVRELDDLAYALKGKKMFYGYTFQSKQEFWRNYRQDLYESLRERFNASSAFSSITDKVLNG
ncbi:FAD-binding oxidoreductase [Estrella lausannensis]|uniref:Delta(24)-sterol reductase n=1 Tax=Estrella lausannensis TaxID=483423 RepID=A0A0H5DS87_9BACT|nr:FAD-binding oxidoreductase [Estrella lausannensis]CRX39158.1 Conserved hypothetical protein [Estrella lausannensis]